MAEAISTRKCALCLVSDVRSPIAHYCAPCHAEVVKRTRRESAARKRREQGLPEIGERFTCGRCSGEVVRNSMAQRYCKPCAKMSALESGRVAKREYEKRNPRKRDKPVDRARQKRWIEVNRDKRLASVTSYNERNREEMRRKSRLHAAKPETKEWRRAWERTHRSKPKHRVDGRMKSAIQQALKGRKSGRSWETLVGYSLNDLVQHLERQFTKGMTWDNIGEWEIDHIRPRAMFHYESADDPAFRDCWGLPNLRPLWRQMNREKSAKRTFLL